MKKLYQWRELTDDGLLKYPKSCGPHYDVDESLQTDLWDTEADAVSALRSYQHKYGQSAPNELVLVTIWRRDY